MKHVFNVNLGGKSMVSPQTYHQYLPFISLSLRTMFFSQCQNMFLINALLHRFSSLRFPLNSSHIPTLLPLTFMTPCPLLGVYAKYINTNFSVHLTLVVWI